MKILRTPDGQFEDLPGYPFAPHYAEVDAGDGDGSSSIRVHYLDEGPPDAAETILLMHGEPSWSYLYRHMVRPLATAGFRVIAPDLVGFGRSDKPAERGEYTYARHVEWMRAALFQGIDLTGVTLVGQDWGGLIGLRLVAEHPDRFRRVVTANTGLPTGDTSMGEAFLAWQRFSQETPEMPIGGIINGGCTTTLSADVIAAYDAPFPDESYKEGARQFPLLVPTRPDDPASAANRRAWEVLGGLDIPWLCAYSDSDPITRGADQLFLAAMPGTRGRKHRPLPAEGTSCRRTAAPSWPRPSSSSSQIRKADMGRKILFITTDQQRYDSMGCTGNVVARTPVVDGLASDGILYHRAHNQNTVCTPARSTMLTGQYVRTHGAVSNGIPLPDDAPSIAAYLQETAGYRTALIGKAHFEPAFDPKGKWEENRLAKEGSTGPHRGFEHLELAMHGYLRTWHYDKWLESNGPEWLDSYYPLINFASMGLNDEGGGDTGAPEIKYNPIPRGMYHTDWVADRSISWLDSLGPDEDWFCWMSFPDPHHPWDPPEEEVRKRVDWHQLDLPAGHPGSPDKIREILSGKPHHWLDWYDGRFQNVEGGPMKFVPASMTHDQVREVNAQIHVENELIDEAVGRVLARIAERGWGDDTDVVFTTDHGELQGDFGLLFKGPYHVDALMRVPLVWRPAPSAGVPAAEIDQPVSHVDLAPTFCDIAGVPVPEWAQGEALPVAAGPGRDWAITEWDSQFPKVGMRLRTIYRDGWVCTAYESGPLYEGTEGELYNLAEDPLQWRNLWNDAGYQTRRAELVTDLYDNLPAERETKLAVEAPV